jgi:hypothetical protein
MAGDIPEVNWATYSLASKYQMMHAGPGSAAVAPAARTLGVLAPAFGESSDVIQAALRGTGVEWQGQAATAFAAKMTQAAEWAQHSGQTSKAGGDQVQSYATSYDTTRNKIPSPVEVGENSFLGKVADGAGHALDDSFGSTFGVQSDYAKRVAANQAADAAANRALTEHVTLTRQAVASFPDTQPGAPLGSAGATATLSSTAHGGVGHGVGGGVVGVGAGGVGPAGVGARAGGAGPAGGATGGAAGGGVGGAAEPTPTHGAGWTPVSPPPGIGAGSGAGVLPGPADGGAGWGGVPAPVSPGGGWDGSGSRGGFGAGPGVSGAGGSGFGVSGVGGAGVGGSGVGGLGGPGVGGLGGGLAPRGGAGFGGAGPGGPGLGGPGVPGRPSLAGVGGFGGGGAPGTGLGGMSPMGGGFGGGAGGEDHEHRNNVFIPSDEPFVVDEGDDVVPPVLGVPGSQW